MSLTIGINHVTTTTTDLDRLVRFYADAFGGRNVFEAAATADDRRMAIVELGGDRYVKVVEDAAAVPDAGPTERFGVAVASLEDLRAVRERMVAAGVDVGGIERIPTQWIVRVTDPDGTPLQVCAHAR